MSNARLPSVLVCDDDSSIHLLLQSFLKHAFEVTSARSIAEATLALKNKQFDIMLLDLQLEAVDDGMRFLPVIAESDPDLPVVIISGRTDFDAVRDAMRDGAVDFISKASGIHADDVLHVIGRTLERRRLIRKEAEFNKLESRVQSQHALIGQSPAIMKVKETIAKLQRSDGNVLIFGDTGSGKEVVARQLRGVNADGSLSPFVAVDSATIQQSTAESALFGHERGSFTGADRIKKGLFEEADGGIIYFDEISNMPLEIQAKLLRVLQEKEITRLGSSKTIQLNFRVVCATNKDLPGLIKKNEFKHDLFQRLNVLPLQIPTLNERKEDIPLLFSYFVERHGGAAQTHKRLSVEATSVLLSYDWPGNVRELSNLVIYLITMVDPKTTEIMASDLPPQLLAAAAQDRPPGLLTAAPGKALSFYDQVMKFEKDLLQHEYRRHGRNIRLLAAHLEMDRTHLYRKLRDYGIYLPPGFRSTADEETVP